MHVTHVSEIMNELDRHCRNPEQSRLHAAMLARAPHLIEQFEQLRLARMEIAKEALERLRAIEHEENELIFRAFWRDIGTVD